MIHLVKKTGTSEVGAISKAQKAQNCKKGDTLGFLKVQFVAKYQKKIEAGTFEDKKKSKKSRTVPKNSKEGPYSPSSNSPSSNSPSSIVRPVLYLTLKIEYTKEGTLCTTLDAFPLAGPVVWLFCRRSVHDAYILLSDEKKLVTVIVGLFL